MLSHLIVLIWALGGLHADSSYVDACTVPSATHYCVYYSPEDQRVIAEPQQSDCVSLELGVALDTLSSDALVECE